MPPAMCLLAIRRVLFFLSSLSRCLTAVTFYSSLLIRAKALTCASLHCSGCVGYSENGWKCRRRSDCSECYGGGEPRDLAISCVTYESVTGPPLTSPTSLLSSDTPRPFSWLSLGDVVWEETLWCSCGMPRPRSCMATTALVARRETSPWTPCVSS